MGGDGEFYEMLLVKEGRQGVLKRDVGMEGWTREDEG